MLKHFLAVILLFFSFSGAVAASQNVSPYEQTRTAAHQLFTAINKNNAKIKRNPNYLKAIVRENLLPYIQIKYSAALILGQYYKTATRTERIAYFNAFEKYLVQALAQALSLYSGQAYFTESAKDLTGRDLISVRVTLVNKDKNVEPILLDFQWRKNSRTGEWKAYDMVAEGISMISTKQNEWSTILRTKGIKALTRQLKKEAQKPIKPEQK